MANYYGIKINLKNPKTYNEKLQWLKLYDRKPIYTIMVDKYLARKFVSERIGEEYLVPLLGVWDNADDIDFSSLPDKFVLKCNHNSDVTICTDKSSLNEEETKKKLAETKKQKERLIDLFTREHISIDEFEEKMAPLKAEISRLEYELTKLSYDAPSDAQFEKALEKTFRRIERITDIRSMTNAQLKEIIEIIEVGKDGVVDIRLKAFEER
jgi:uncharacterized small protein (DUF1192 family)